MNLLKYITVFALVLSLAACDDYLDINVDPNQPDKPGDIELLLADMTSTTAYNLVGGGNWSRYGAQWMQHIADNSTPPNDDTYRINTSDCNNEWAFYSYAGVLANGTKIVAFGGEEGRLHHVGVAKVLMAHNFALLTDWWGDIPYSNALLREDNIKPSYDTQEKVYEGIVQLLDEGIAQLEKESPISLGAGDLLLNGDPAAWIRFANALKARYALRLTNAPGKDDQVQAQLALDALTNAMTGPADEAAFPYSATPGQESPWQQWVDKFANTMQASDYFVTKLQNMSDPRLAMVADTTNLGIYQGHLNGSTPTNTLAERSAIGAYYLDPELDIPIMTYVEQLFIKAEAHWRLEQTGEAEAAYAEAVRLHMGQLSGKGELGILITEADVDDYLLAHPLTGLADLIEQKYIAGYLLSSFEAYNDWRRTGFPADLAPVQNADIPQIPTRMIYTDTEVNNNIANVPTGVTLTSKVWWDAD